MAFARDTYVATASQTDFVITYPYLAETDVIVYQNGSVVSTDDYIFATAALIRLDTGATVGDAVTLQRNTTQATRRVDFTAGPVVEADLDNSALQLFYMSQESLDRANISIGSDTALIWDAENIRIKDVGTPTLGGDAVNKTYADSLVAAAVTSEEHTATASQTVFTLTGITYTPGVNNLTVFINGVHQASGAYTETSATVVTFSSGLTVGDLVVFHSAEILTTTTSQASVSVYTPDGTGAVDTNVQAKLRERVSVKDFGAIGNGVTDDTAAIQLALTAARSVYFPAGTYEAQGLSVPANTVVYGDGASTTLRDQTAAVARHMFTLAGDNIKLRDMVIEGGQGASTSTYYATNTAIVNANDAADYSDIELSGLEIRGWGAGGISIYRPERVYCHHNYIHDCGRHGIFYFGGNDSHIHDNHISDMGPGSGGAAPFINAYGVSLTNDISTASFPQSDGCTIKNNRIDNITTWEGIDVHGAVNFEISGNVVTDCMIGTFLGPSDGTNNSMCDHGVISNNTFTTTATYQRAGILLAPSYNVGTLYGSQFVINNNRIEGHGINQATYNAGYTDNEGAIEVVGARDVTISGNNILGANQIGIHLEQAILGCSVVGNRVVDMVVTNSQAYCLRNEVPSTTIAEVHGNTFQRLTGTSDAVDITGSLAAGYGVRYGHNYHLGAFTTVFTSGSLALIHDDSEWSKREIASAYITKSGAATIAKSHGITSAVTGGTGITTITLANTQPDANYSIHVTPKAGSFRVASVNSNSTTTFVVYTWNSSHALVDSAFHVMVTGQVNSPE